MTTAWALGPIVAPAIGGYLQYYVGWQANFLFLAAYGLIGLLFIRFLLPETNEHMTPMNLKNIHATYKEIIAHFIFIGAVICMAIVYSLIILSKFA